MQSDTAKTVFVGLSGGVDSSVAALRLIKEGYNVVGVFIKVWQPDWLDCNWEAERLDAMRVAAKLDITFLTCDAEKAYKDDVADYFISEYKKGRTPNPDVMCNKYVKFGAFLKFAEEHGAEYIATGHYAQNIKPNQNNDILSKGYYPCNHQLYRGVDEGKDQTYFLWTLTQEQLSKILFPVGDSAKNVIRKEALDAGLLTANKKDSQGICFLGHIDIPEFLAHYIDLKKGDVLNDLGEVIGEHVGALVYTTGQRHGFTITEINNKREALYVTDRNIERNTITVSVKKKLTTNTNTICLTSVNIIADKIELQQTLQFQTRYRQTPVAGKVTAITEDTIVITPLEKSDAPGIGQSCVLYDGQRCLAGGIITKCQSK